MSRFYAVTPYGETVAYPDGAPEVLVDVRADLRAGRQPYARIMAGVDGLRAGEVLRVRAPFAPVPLVASLSERGFVYYMDETGPDDWSVWFWRPE